MDWYIDLAFSVVISLLRKIIKNPDSKETMRKVFRKVYDLTLQAYPEFEV